jgi:hypothetical protein
MTTTELRVTQQEHADREQWKRPSGKARIPAQRFRWRPPSKPSVALK